MSVPSANGWEGTCVIALCLGYLLLGYGTRFRLAAARITGSTQKLVSPAWQEQWQGARRAAGQDSLLLEIWLLQHRGVMGIGGERQLCSALPGHRCQYLLWLPGEGSATLTLTTLWAPAGHLLLPDSARAYTVAAPLLQLYSRNIREGRAHT